MAILLEINPDFIGAGPCPDCGGETRRNPSACWTWASRSKPGTFTSCADCDSAVLYTCKEDCGWSWLNGMNPANPAAKHNDTKKPTWAPPLEVDCPNMPDEIDMPGMDDPYDAWTVQTTPAPPEKGTFAVDGKWWRTSHLIELTKDLPIEHMAVGDFPEWQEWPWEHEMTLQAFYEHMKRVMGTDLSKPIILMNCGTIMDGCHRLVKAKLLGQTLIPTVRFLVCPEPDGVVEDDGFDDVSDGK